MLKRIRGLYEDNTALAHRFRYALLAFDLTTIVFVIVTSFFPHTPNIEIVDGVFGVLILIDFLIRFALEKQRLSALLRPATWADLIAVGSFLVPIAGEGFGFLRNFAHLTPAAHLSVAGKAAQRSELFSEK